MPIERSRYGQLELDVTGKIFGDDLYPCIKGSLQGERRLTTYFTDGSHYKFRFERQNLDDPFINGCFIGTCREDYLDLAVITTRADTSFEKLRAGGVGLHQDRDRDFVTVISSEGLFQFNFK